MRKRTKDRIISVFLVFIGISLCCIGSGVTGLISKNCPKCESNEVIKEIEVVKEVEDESCKTAKSNESIYEEILSIDNEGFLIMADIFENLEYYLYYPDEIDHKVEEIEVLVIRKNTLLNELE